VQAAQLSPELADAADVLSDRHREELSRFVQLLEPHIDRMDARFQKRLGRLRYDSKQRKALAAITLGAAARILAEGHPLLKFIEQVEYNGRRLAKLNLAPSAVLEALKEYDQAFAAVLGDRLHSKHETLEWVREQLHFCVVLTLNNAYYQVRELETQAFYEQFRIELEARNLERTAAAVPRIGCSSLPGGCRMFIHA
jgi:hypothetical protein